MSWEARHTPALVTHSLFSLTATDARKLGHALGPGLSPVLFLEEALIWSQQCCQRAWGQPSLEAGECLMAIQPSCLVFSGEPLQAPFLHSAGGLPRGPLLGGSCGPGPGPVSDVSSACLRLEGFSLPSFLGVGVPGYRNPGGAKIRGACLRASWAISQPSGVPGVLCKWLSPNPLMAGPQSLFILVSPRFSLITSKAESAPAPWAES